ncbi:UNVERIFIED_CONTAM: hypothetical protein RMT77_011552 [Armadillidium vulgare]
MIDDLGNMSMEDTENNNVDENSNDHHFNEFADYHHQYTNHQYRRHIVSENIQSNNEVEQISRAPVVDRVNNGDVPSNSDAVDSCVPQYRQTSGFHRRNMSEDFSLNTENLPPLPRNPNCIHHGELSNRSRDWIPPLYRRRPRVSDEEVQAQGRELLYNFAAEQFREEDLNLYDYLQISPSGSWKSEGRTLRLLADEFSRSQERKVVRDRAKGVHMDSLTCENFFHLCCELFHKDGGGITQERIVVLFTFITDIAIQQVRQRTERFLSQLMEWSLRFIFDHICSWVREAGGWGAVLSHGANICYKVTIFVFAAVSLVALGIFIKKNWKDL